MPAWSGAISAFFNCVQPASAEPVEQLIITNIHCHLLSQFQQSAADVAN